MKKNHIQKLKKFRISFKLLIPETREVEDVTKQKAKEQLRTCVKQYIGENCDIKVITTNRVK